MLIQIEKLHAIKIDIEKIIKKIEKMETEYAEEINLVNNVYRKSAINLIHYLGLRSFDIDNLQDQLSDLGLPGLSNAEPHVMSSLLTIHSILSLFLGKFVNKTQKGIISVKKSKSILNRNTKLLFGYKSKRRRTRIMVTLPGSIGDDYKLVNGLIKSGMNSARINCAHDDAITWKKMISNVHRSSEKNSKKCKIMMDLSGPKIRTGSMQDGPKVIHIKPEKDMIGQVTKPAKIWLAPPDLLPPTNNVVTHIPVSKEWVNYMKKNDFIQFKDTRGKKIQLTIGSKHGYGRWGYCFSSAYVLSGTEFKLFNSDKKIRNSHIVGEFQPLMPFILLKTNDYLTLHGKPIQGESAEYDKNGLLLKNAHISCTLPEIFSDVKKGEHIYFDDGKIEGIIENANKDDLLIKIKQAKNNGSKLKADKGINLPDSDLNISGLTNKDREDIKFVVYHADTINLSFVNNEEDVQELLEELSIYDSKIGIILKIETQKGFKNLAKIILKAMQTFPVGVMIARGDLAIETGWKNFASIQEEIFRMCEAAHIPVVLATQVLENLTKKGTPSRAEITDVAMAQRAECVMLNKGVYIKKSVKMLDTILKRMQHFQKKKETILPKLDEASDLIISHNKFNID